MTITVNDDSRPARSSAVFSWTSLLDHILVPASVVLVFTLWEFLTRYYEVPQYLVPAPTAVLRSLANMWGNGLLQQHGSITLLEALGGFLIAFSAAMLFGVLIAESRLFERVVYPYLAAMQSMPKVALAPLIMIWFGMGIESKIVLSALLAFFPMLVNTVEGLKSVDPKRVSLLKVVGASRLQTMWLLKIPNALPFMLAGIELGAIYAMLGAIVAEFVGSPFGIGAYLMSMTYQMDAAGSFAILLVLAVYGMTVQLTLRAVRRRFLFWSRLSTNPDGGA
jgi:NitT/TauT family transport system permease protein